MRCWVNRQRPTTDVADLFQTRERGRSRIAGGCHKPYRSKLTYLRYG